MDAEQLRFLPDTLKDAYSRQMATLESPGWDDIVAWAQANLKSATDRQLSAQNWGDSRVAYGARTVFNMIVNLRDTTEKEFALAAADFARQATPESESEWAIEIDEDAE